MVNLPCESRDPVTIPAREAREKARELVPLERNAPLPDPTSVRFVYRPPNKSTSQETSIWLG
jgi:hypothetical protein